MRRLSSLVTVGLIFSSSVWGENHRIEMKVSGANGRSGANGMPGMTTGSSGTAGGHGEAGADAGTIDLELLTPGDGPKFLEIRGTLQPVGSPPQSVNMKVAPGKSGSLELSAKGGDGGRGGNGGFGARGQRGSDGHDAIFHVPGGSGGPGGPGGHAGHSGDGAAGGNGGEISLRLKDRDTHWLMLLGTHDVRCGVGGRPGHPGAGGDGGEGGRGGSGYHGSDFVTRTESYSVPDGRGGSSTQFRTVTDSVPYYTPGGSDGPQGPRGMDGAQGKPGTNGQNGKFRIRVTDETGRAREYRSRYDLALESFELQNTAVGGIFEPGDTVKVKNIKIKNSGGMPTPPPPYSFVEVTLTGDERLSFETKSLSLPKVLAVGETYTFPGTLEFKIAPPRPGELPAAGSAFRSAQNITPKAVLSTVDRDFGNFKSPQCVVVQFPIEIKPIRALPAIAANEGTRVFFEIVNKSNVELGTSSDLKRQIGMLIHGSAEKGGNFDLSFRDSEGNRMESSALFKAIDHLKPGETRIVEGVLTAPRAASPQSTYHLDSTLGLAPRHSPDQAQPIQARRHRIAVVDSYVKSPDSSVLLIANASTKPEELEAWKQTLAKSGLKADVWNLSYYGFLELGKNLASSNGSLFEDLRGKTIVLLNHRFVSDASRETEGADYAAKREILEAAQKHGINLLILGDDEDSRGEKLVKSLLVPTHQAPEQYFGTVTKFRETMKKLPDAFGRGTGGALRAETPNASYRIGIARRYFGYPTERDLTDIAKEVQSFLDYEFPNRRYVVVPKYHPRVLEQGGYVSRKLIGLGELEVRQLTDSPENVLTSVKVPEKRLQDPEYIRSVVNQEAFFAALPFDKKAQVLQSSLAELKGPSDLPRVQALVDTMLADISHEQRAALEGFWRHRTELRQRNLEMLSKMKPTRPVHPGSSAEQALIRLVAGTRLMADYSVSSLWWITGPLRLTNGRATSAFTTDWIDTWGRAQYANPKDWDRVQALIDKQWYALRDQASRNAAANRTSKLDEIHKLMQAPLRRDGVTAATQVWTDSLSRIMSENDFQAMKAADLSDERTREKLIADNLRAKKELTLGRNE